MSGGVFPIISGLVIGITFIVIIALIFSSPTIFPNKVKPDERFGDVEGQQMAANVLLTDPGVRTFVAGKNFEVWAYGANYPQASLNEGVCDKDKCTLIGIRERNTDGSFDCAIKAFVNVQTRQVDDVQYSRPCDER